MIDMYITDYLEKNAIDYGSEPALICADRTMTWKELWEEVVALATKLAPRLPTDTQGVVGLLLPNSWQFMVSYLAIAHAGHICMPLDPMYKQLEVGSVVEQIPPVFAITDLEHAPYFPEGIKVDIFDELYMAEPPKKKGKFLRTSPHTQATSLLFTSGTTGKPKATQYTHANHLWNVEVSGKLWKWDHTDSLLVSLPLSHWHGLSMGVTGMIRHASTMYLQERFDAEATLKELASGRISLFMHVPIAYYRIVELENAKTYDISAVRLCVSGSSYLPPAIWHQFKELFGHEILERYGSSETGLVASNTLEKRVPGWLGKPLEGVELKQQPDGELLLRSPGLFPGYFNNPEATKAKFVDGDWWLTGDIGEFDDEGNLRLLGRVVEKMKKMGYTVYPRDVEWALLKHPKISDAFVLSEQHEQELSDTFVYFVVGGVSENDVLDYSKENMPPFWRPDKVILLDEIPKSPAGKPKLALLKARLADENLG